MKKFKFIGLFKSTFLFLLFLPMTLMAQQSITLDECFDLVSKNYPLARQSDLLQNQLQLDMEALEKGKLPQLDVNAQASYQSDVTSLPIQLPNVTIDPPNKDQYRATLDVNQLIYNGGQINALAKVTEAKGKVGQQEVVVNLYQLKNQVNQLYLSVLLLQENRTLLNAKEKQLMTRLDEVNSGVKFGMLLPSSADALEVELLKIKQNYAELDHSKAGLLDRLSLLIGKDLNNNVALQRPEVVMDIDTDPNRPELTLFELQKEQVQFSTELLSKSKLPKLSAFALGGYGNPGLNMLDNSFNTFYMTGLRLNWNVFDWNKNKTEKQSLQINKEIINTQKETFELNNNVELTALLSEINKITELISYDEAIIPLREKMVKTAESQLKNGVITSSAYITEFTNLYEAKNNLALHKTQMLLTQIQYQISKGTYGQ
ncbi:TolC family protein [Maribacter arenosus]|uniref:TolC family protein n=1 Tax=Maribacter arenosus TaxID=1854708 RepID=A0ABR7V9Z5_9FLAO|nr:TolC family protein [Maribacter arenosus]MBD0850131.1 TolC family protein [Maribacter arenosus]